MAQFTRAIRDRPLPPPSPDQTLMACTVKVTVTDGPDKLVALPCEPRPVVMGMHDELAEFFGAPDGSFTPHASTLDYVVGALAGCMAGTFKRALASRGIALSPADWDVTAVGTIVVCDRVPTLSSVEVAYVLSNTDSDDHEKIKRAHAVHHRACAVSRSLEAAINISSSLELA
jgi:uncharacterized OsmC-like protein